MMQCDVDDIAVDDLGGVKKWKCCVDEVKSWTGQLFVGLLEKFPSQELLESFGHSKSTEKYESILGRPRKKIWCVFDTIACKPSDVKSGAFLVPQRGSSLPGSQWQSSKTWTLWHINPRRRKIEQKAFSTGRKNQKNSLNAQSNAHLCSHHLVTLKISAQEMHVQGFVSLWVYAYAADQFFRVFAKLWGDRQSQWGCSGAVRSTMHVILSWYVFT